MGKGWKGINDCTKGALKMAKQNQWGGESDDLTPMTGAATDVAPLGRTGEKPAHERTADEEPDVVDWEVVAASAEFRSLLAAKRRFILPAILFFVSYYFALPLLVGYAPELMRREVLGVVNLAYLFALSQFFVAWLMAALYLRVAARFDRAARQIIQQAKGDR
jgi:uncharacterized membrane protein (DUF485 family)